MSRQPQNSEDELVIKPFGGGQEVGRSCIMIEFKGKRVLLDFGLHPGLTGADALPHHDYENTQFDLLLVTHFHIDHCGGVPWLLKVSQLKCMCVQSILSTCQSQLISARIV